MNFSDLIFKKLASTDTPIRRFAKSIETDRKTIYRWLSGEMVPTLRMFKRAMMFFGIEEGTDEYHVFFKAMLKGREMEQFAQSVLIDFFSRSFKSYFSNSNEMLNADELTAKIFSKKEEFTCQ